MRSLWMGLVVGVAACGGPIQAGDAGGGHDAGGDARVALCASAMECRGTDECTTYDCRPGDPAADARGCVVEPMCTVEQVCRSGVCVRSCTPEEADGDGDDFDNPGCGGADCNDAVNTINPGATEVCDPAGVDEDCNPNTIRGSDPREGDADNDGLISSACWNPRPDGTENRGPDCDDALPGSQLGTVGHCSRCGDACQFRCDSGSCTGLGQVSVGNSHTCSLDGRGHAYCWGSNSFGQLGDGTLSPSGRPVQVFLSEVREIAVGAEHTCARVPYPSGGSDTVRCWGRNSSGQLGDGTTMSSQRAVIPILSLFSPQVHQVAAGLDNTAVVRTDARVVFCWGSSVGCGLPAGTQSTPVELAGVRGVVDLALGWQHGCAVLNNGHVSCWGMNRSGQTGQPTSLQGPLTPTEVPGITNAVQVEAGSAHTCVLLSDGGVRCWGAHDGGSLGAGLEITTTCGTVVSDFHACTAVPTSPLGLGGIAEITPYCARGLTGTIWCWGGGALEPAVVDVQLDSLTSGPGFRSDSISLRPARAGNTCGHMAGRLVCWGSINAAGQLGNGTTTSPSAPMPVLPPG